MTINCIIIDDDPIVQGYLRAFIIQIPFLNLIAIHSTAEEALLSLENSTVQLMFLDIGMPGMNGMEFAKILNVRQGHIPPRIVFISGFERYAVDSYQVNALDYLLKPVKYEDFLKSAYKAEAYFSAVNTLPTHTDVPAEFIFLKVEHELIRVELKEILYIEGMKDYVKVFLKGESHWVKALITMKSIEEKLPSNLFMRVHRSFIISLDKIDTVHHQTIKIGKTIIPVTEQYKDLFKDYIQQWY